MRCAAVCIGPSLVPCASPGPTFSRLALAVIASMTSSATDSIHVDALDRQAGLAAVVEAAHARRAGGGRQVGVVADDHRVRAAELERDALGAAAARAMICSPTGRRAGEGDLATSRVRDERRRRPRSRRPVTTLNMPSGRPPSASSSAKRSVVRGVVAGRLGHDGVAGDQRRRRACCTAAWSGSSRARSRRPRRAGAAQHVAVDAGIEHRGVRAAQRLRHARRSA